MMTHDQAIDAICGCVTVSVLSYQEAIEAYFLLRELPIPPDCAKLPQYTDTKEEEDGR